MKSSHHPKTTPTRHSAFFAADRRTNMAGAAVVVAAATAMMLLLLGCRTDRLPQYSPLPIGLDQLVGKDTGAAGGLGLKWPDAPLSTQLGPDGLEPLVMSMPNFPGRFAPRRIIEREWPAPFSWMGTIVDTPVNFRPVEPFYRPALAGTGVYLLVPTGPTAVLVDVRTGKQVRSLIQPTRIESVAISRDGRWAYTADAEGTVRRWNLLDHRLANPADGGFQTINPLPSADDAGMARRYPDMSLLLSACGRWLVVRDRPVGATGEAPRFQRVVQAVSGEFAFDIPPDYALIGFTYTHGLPILRGPARAQYANTQGTSPIGIDGGDSPHALGPAARNAIEVWDPRSRQHFFVADVGADPAIWQLASDGKHLFGHNPGMPLQVFAVDTREFRVRRINVANRPVGLALSADGKRLIHVAQVGDSVELKLFDFTADTDETRLLNTVSAERMRQFGISRCDAVMIRADGALVTLVDGMRLRSVAIPETPGQPATDHTADPLRDPFSGISAMSATPTTQQPGRDSRRDMRVAVARFNGALEWWAVDPTADDHPFRKLADLREPRPLSGGALPPPDHFTQVIATPTVVAAAYDSQGQRGFLIVHNLAERPRRTEITDLGVATLALAPGGRFLVAVGNAPGTRMLRRMVFDLQAPDPSEAVENHVLDSDAGHDRLAVGLRQLRLTESRAFAVVDQRIEVWTPDLARRLAVVGPGRHLALGADGAFMAVNHGTGRLSINDADSGLQLSSHRLSMPWPTRRGALSRPFDSPDGQDVTDLVVHGDRLFVAGTDGVIRLWQFPAGRRMGVGELSLHAWPDFPTCMSLSVLGDRLFVGTAGGRVIVFDVNRLWRAPDADANTALPAQTYFPPTSTPADPATAAPTTTSAVLALRRTVVAPAIRALGIARGDGDDTQEWQDGPAVPFAVSLNRLVVANPGHGISAYQLPGGTHTWFARFARDAIAIDISEAGEVGAALGPLRVEIFSPATGRWMFSVRVPQGMNWVRVSPSGDFGTVGGPGGLMGFDPRNGRAFAWQPGNFPLGTFSRTGELVAMKIEGNSRLIVRFDRAGAVQLRRNFPSAGHVSHLAATAEDVLALGPGGLIALETATLLPKRTGPSDGMIRRPMDGENYDGALGLCPTRAFFSHRGDRGDVFDVTSQSTIGARIPMHFSQATRRTRVLDVRFSPNGALLVTQDDRGFFRVYDVGTGTVRADAPVAVSVRKIVFSPNGRMLAVLYTDGAIRTFDAVDGQELKSPSMLAHDIAFAADATRQILLVAARDSVWPFYPDSAGFGDPVLRSTARILATDATGRQMAVLTADGGVIVSPFPPDRDGARRVFTVPSTEMAAPTPPTLGFVRFAWGLGVVVGTTGRVQVIRDGDHGGEVFPVQPGSRWAEMPVSADTELAPLVFAEGSRIRLAGHTQPIVDDADAVVDVAGWLPWAVVMARPTALSIVDAQAERFVWSLHATGDRIEAIALSPDRTQIAVATRRGAIYALDLARTWRHQR